jgi:hypothetical protein
VQDSDGPGYWRGRLHRNTSTVLPRRVQWLWLVTFLFISFWPRASAHSGQIQLNRIVLEPRKAARRAVMLQDVFEAARRVSRPARPTCRTETMSTLRSLQDSVFPPAGSVEEHRLRVQRAAQERAALRDSEIEAQASPMKDAQERIGIWERLHALSLPRAPEHVLVKVIARQTRLTIGQVHEEQQRRAGVRSPRAATFAAEAAAQDAAMSTVPAAPAAQHLAEPGKKTLP